MLTSCVGPLQIEVKFFASPATAAASASAAAPAKPKRRMATVTTDSLAHAVTALIRCHNLKLKEFYLRVTFAHPKADSKPNPAAAAAAAAAAMGVAPAQFNATNALMMAGYTAGPLTGMKG